MPRAAPKPCTQMGCDAQRMPGYRRCADHNRERLPRKARPQDRMLHSRQWRRLSARVIAEEPVCMIRLRCHGAPSQVADHIVERADGGALWDRANLQGACIRCNVAKGQRAAQARRREAPRT